MANAGLVRWRQVHMTSMTSRTEYSTQTQKTTTLFFGQYLLNHWTLDLGVLGYIGTVWPKEHSPEVRSFPPGTPFILFDFTIYECGYVFMYVCMFISMFKYIRIIYLNIMFLCLFVDKCLCFMCMFLCVYVGKNVFKIYLWV